MNRWSSESKLSLLGVCRVVKVVDKVNCQSSESKVKSLAFELCRVVTAFEVVKAPVLTNAKKAFILLSIP